MKVREIKQNPALDSQTLLALVCGNCYLSEIA